MKTMKIFGATAKDVGQLTSTKMSSLLILHSICKFKSGSPKSDFIYQQKNASITSI